MKTPARTTSWRRVLAISFLVVGWFALRSHTASGIAGPGDMGVQTFYFLDPKMTIRVGGQRLGCGFHGFWGTTGPYLAEYTFECTLETAPIERCWYQNNGEWLTYPCLDRTPEGP